MKKNPPALKFPCCCWPCCCFGKKKAPDEEQQRQSPQSEVPDQSIFIPEQPHGHQEPKPAYMPNSQGMAELQAPSTRISMESQQQVRNSNRVSLDTLGDDEARREGPPPPSYDRVMDGKLE